MATLQKSRPVQVVGHGQTAQTAWPDSCRHWLRRNGHFHSHVLFLPLAARFRHGTAVILSDRLSSTRAGCSVYRHFSRSSRNFERAEAFRVLPALGEGTVAPERPRGSGDAALAGTAVVPEFGKCP